MTKLIIYGNSRMAEVMASYIGETDDIELIAFTVEQEWITDSHLCGKPVVAFEEIYEKYPPQEYSMLVLTSLGVSSPRMAKKKKSGEIKRMGYQLITYIDPAAFVARTAQVGENCILFHGAVVEPFAVIDDGTILRSGAYVSHHSRVGEYCYLSPRACIAGKAEVKPFCFLGINCTIHDRVTIGHHAIIGGGAVVNKDVGDRMVIKAAPGVPLKKESSGFAI